MLIKPEKIYEDPKPVLNIEEAVKEMSFADKLKLYTQLQQEVAPAPQEKEIIPALGDEEVREMVLDEWERKEVLEEEPLEEPALIPSMNKSSIPATEFEKPTGWEKPEGWDKGPSFLQILWGGITDKDMDPSDYKRYDVFVTRLRPLIIIILTGLLAYGAYKVINMEPEKGDVQRNDSYIDKVMNWGREKYDNFTGRSIQVQESITDTVPTKYTPRVVPVKLIRPGSTPVELLTARDSAINYIP